MKYLIKVVLLLLTTMFSEILLAADCPALFKRLDKQSRAIPSSAGKVKQQIALEQALFKAIDQCRKFSGMFVLMGELQIEMGQVPLAVVYGRKSVELDSSYGRAYKLLGSAKILNNESESGLKVLRHAYSIEPKNLNIKLNLVSALIHNNKFNEGLELVNKVIEKNNPDHIATAYYLRSQAYKGKGLVIEADNDLKRAKNLGFVTQ